MEETRKQWGYCKDIKLLTWHCGETKNWGEADGEPEVYCYSGADPRLSPARLVFAILVAVAAFLVIDF